MQIREADRGDGIQRMYLGVARKLWMILKQFPNVKRSRMIAGAGSQMLQVDYTLKELEGEFNFDMDFGAMMADNPVTRASRAAMNYNLMRGDPKVDPNWLIGRLLKSQNETDIQAAMLVLKTPIEEIQIMQQGLPVEAHERDDHEQHIQMHDAQSGRIDRDIIQARKARDAETSMTLSTLQIILGAHVKQHEIMYEQMGGNIEGDGKPQAENMLRSQIRGQDGSETAAELTGGPLSPDGMVS